jgi:hypothetical protein
MSEYLTTPVGRLVQGSFFQPNETDFYGKPRETPQYFAGLAVEKNNPEWPAFWNALVTQAQQDFAAKPHLLQSQDFAWKVVDGDDPKYAAKEGFQGHYVIKCTTSFAPQVFDNNMPPQPIVNQDQAKRGYFFRFGVSFKGNGDDNKPGMYINLVMAQLMGFGPEIHGGPDASQVFGQQAGYVPQGMSQTPVGGGNMPSGGNNMMPNNNNMAPGNVANQSHNMMQGGGNNMMPANNNMMPANNTMTPGTMPNNGGNMMPANNNMMPANNGMDPNAGHGGNAAGNVHMPQNANGPGSAMTSHTNNIQPHNNFLNGPQ